MAKEESVKLILLDIAPNLAALVLCVIGLMGNQLYIAAGIACLGIGMIRKPGQKRFGYVVLVVAVLFFIAVFGYGFGKGMAIQDNAASQESVPKK